MVYQDVGVHNFIFDLLGGVLEYVAQPIFSQACVLDIYRAQVRHYPGTRGFCTYQCMIVAINGQCLAVASKG